MRFLKIKTVPTLFWSAPEPLTFRPPLVSVAPLVIGAPFLRAYLLAEHAGCDEGDGNMLANTRTLLTTAPVRFIAWNMPYHTEHHSFPAVPFHALPRLHRVMKDDIRHLESGYIGFHRRFVRKLSGMRAGDA